MYTCTTKSKNTCNVTCKLKNCTKNTCTCTIHCVHVHVFVDIIIIFVHIQCLR